MTSLAAAGALCGAVFAAGVALVWARLPGRREPSLIARLEPYLRDTATPSRLLRPAPSGPGRPWLRPLLARAGRALEAVLGGADSVARRQQGAGHGIDVAAFRAEQIAWGAGGAVLGAALGALAWVRDPRSALAPVALVLIGAAAGVLTCDQRLTRRVARRQHRMRAEFPTIAELLALSVSAGEGAAAALERVCRCSRGDLSEELSAALADVRAGSSVPAALRALADRTGLPALARFVDGLVVALERGTPLAQVLRAQAQDVREEGRRLVVESAGRKEIQMLVPVVFLILPVTILFAVYPGLLYLRLTP